MEQASFISHWLREHRGWPALPQIVVTANCEQQKDIDCGAYILFFAERLAGTMSWKDEKRWVKDIKQYRANAAIKILRHPFSHYMGGSIVHADTGGASVAK